MFELCFPELKWRHWNVVSKEIVWRLGCLFVLWLKPPLRICWKLLERASKVHFKIYHGNITHTHARAFDASKTYVLLLSLPKLHSSAWSTVKHFIMSHLSHDAHKTDAQQTIFSVRFAIWAEAWKQRQATHMPAVKAWACSSVKMYFWDVFPCLMRTEGGKSSRKGTGINAFEN